MRTLVRWGLPAVLVAGCVGYLIVTASGASAEYYVTVSELRANPTTDHVRVAGVVQDDIQKSGLRVSFTEKDGTASMPVDYTGTLPDIFKPGITVVVDGTMGADGVFHASTLLAKCPSRFSTKPYTS